MQILYSLLGSVVIAIVVTWYFSWYFSKKTKNLQIDLSGFIIREITKNPNYSYPIVDKYGKLHLVIELNAEEKIALGDNPTLVKKE